MAHARIGPVRDTQDDDGKFAGSGFVLYSDDGGPAATLGFSKTADAQAAAEKLSEIIAMCQQVTKEP
jgi:hypothetical protein